MALEGGKGGSDMCVRARVRGAEGEGPGELSAARIDELKARMGCC